MTTRTARERVVYAAAQSLRRRGMTGTGLRGVVAEARAPWGSLHHYFPRGKEQLVGEAISWSADLAATDVRRYLDGSVAPTPEGLFASIVDRWRTDLRRSDFALGCPVVGAVADGADGAVREACARALQTWRHPIRDGLVQMGAGRRRADDLATLMIASLEGAILACRLARSDEPLSAVERGLRPALRLDASPP